VSFTTLFVLLLAGSALAYFLILANGAGSGSATLGKSAGAETMTLHATFANGLTPGNHEAVAFTAENKTKAASDIRKFTVTPSLDASHPGCKPEWFTITNGGNQWNELTTTGTDTPIQLAVGETKNITSELELSFVDSGTNQSACEGATLTLNLSSTP
jgi:hypothetical protein